MLLRSSRIAARLSKEASALGRVGKLTGGAVGTAGKLLGGVAGAVGKTITKHPIGSLATLGGLSGAAFFGAPAVMHGEMGMRPEYLAAQSRGLVERPRASMSYQQLDRHPARGYGRQVRNTRIFR